MAVPFGTAIFIFLCFYIFSISLLTRTNVRFTIVIEQTFYFAVFCGCKGGLLMTGWTLFFIVIGVAVLTAQLFRVIDFIEHPRRAR